MCTSFTLDDKEMDEQEFLQTLHKLFSKTSTHFNN